MLKLFLALVFCLFVQQALTQESGERETVTFAYDWHTQMMVVTKQAICYIFVLTSSEKALVHSDAGMRSLQLQVLGQLNNPSLNLTTVPHDALHSNIQKECGKGAVKHYIIQ